MNLECFNYKPTFSGDLLKRVGNIFFVARPNIDSARLDTFSFKASLEGNGVFYTYSAMIEEIPALEEKALQKIYCNKDDPRNELG